MPDRWIDRTQVLPIPWYLSSEFDEIRKWDSDLPQISFAEWEDQAANTIIGLTDRENVKPVLVLFLAHEYKEFCRQNCWGSGAEISRKAFIEAKLSQQPWKYTHQEI